MAGALRIIWSDLRPDGAARLDGRAVEIEGWFAAGDPAAVSDPAHRYFFLTEEPACCAACLPQAADRLLTVHAALPVTPTAGQPLRLAGILRLGIDAAGVCRGALQDARLLPPSAAATIVPGFSRRAALVGGLAAGLSAWMPAGCSRAQSTPAPEGTDRTALAGSLTMDLHSHAGRVLPGRNPHADRPFRPLAAPMRAGAMAVISLAVVADSPATHVEDRRIRPYRDPAPGELYTYIATAFARLQALVHQEGLAIVTDRASLAAAATAGPAVIVCSEGGDFLEGRAERIDEACERWQLRQLQLTHYRVNELGDIQTEPPVHGGLTAAGAAAIRRCNRRGVVVDVAHGTYELVKRAADVTEKPLVLSHTSLNPKPGRYSRTISPDHARVVAGTGGVIGIWPPATIFPDLTALAEGMARMVDVAGIEHVGLGSDMMGLLSPAAFDSYAELPALAGALRGRGFNSVETGKLLGGNAARVFAASLA